MILEILEESDEALSTAEIHEEVRKRDGDLTARQLKANLNELQKKGLIIKVVGRSPVVWKKAPFGKKIEVEA